MNQKGSDTMKFSVIKPDQIEEVKQMILLCAYELWKPQQSFDQFAQELDKQDEFEDFVDIHSSYLGNKGTFLVLTDNQKIVGAGGIRKFDDEICELMRLWFCKEYRGQGLGFKMAEQLLAFAKEQGYKKIRLDVYHPEIQTKAVALYKKLGFYEIPAYNNYPAKLWMEKVL